LDEKHIGGLLQENGLSAFGSPPRKVNFDANYSFRVLIKTSAFKKNRKEGANLVVQGLEGGKIEGGRAAREEGGGNLLVRLENPVKGAIGKEKEKAFEKNL